MQQESYTGRRESRAAEGPPPLVIDGTQHPLPRDLALRVLELAELVARAEGAA